MTTDGHGLLHVTAGWRWTGVAAVGLAGILLVVAFRGANAAHILELLERGRLEVLALALACLAGSYAVRAYRWRVLLSVRRALPPAVAFSALMVGYLGNNFLPMRAGEVMRTVLLGRRTGLSKSFVAGTIVAERLTDLVGVAVFGTVALAWVHPAPMFAPDWLVRASAVAGAGGLLGLLGLVASPRGAQVSQWVTGWSVWPSAVRRHVATIVRDLLVGAQALTSVRRGAVVAAATCVIWILDASAMVIVANALALTLAFPLAALLVVALALSSAMPSTPGYLGVFQFVTVSVLAPFGFARDESLALIIAYQIVAYAAVVVGGLAGFWHLRPWTHIADGDPE